MENQLPCQHNGNPPSAASSSVLASSGTPSSESVQLHASSSPRSRCHPGICDVMRLETIRERNSVYSEDGEFIDLPLPPVPHSASTATDSTVSDCDERATEYQRQMPGVSVQAEAYLQSRLREFEEEDGPIGNGYIGEGDCVEEIILAPSIDDSISASGVTYCDQPETMRSTLDGRVVEEDLKSIDSSTSNTLRKSAWSVMSTGSTGDECSNGEDYESRFSQGDDSEDDDDNPAEEDDYGERSSGYREKSPFLRSISLSPVERRYRKHSLASRERSRKSASSGGRDASAVGGNWKYQRTGKHGADDSTCCDDDFTWVHAHSRSEAPKASVESDRRSSSQATTSRSVPHEQRGQVMPTKHQPQRQLTRSSTSTASGAVASGKPPRPMRDTGSLDRRRNLATSRHERDCKSRSTHSLKEKSSSSEFHKHDSLSSNLSLNAKDQLHDSGSFNNYNSSGSSSLHQQQHQNQHNPRHSPSIWEPPPPPPLSHWDPHYYWSYPHYHHQHQSREELRLIDYHRRQQELYQYGSTSALGSTQDLSCSSGCCSRSYYPTPFPPPPGACCPYEHRPQCTKELQRQDTDERLRRLQTDKEALAMQVKTLTEQVQTQGTKISELERTVKEKNQLLSNAEDLLQREMLSRSSLETQKLELMSAMSELKLQQAALERENLELRTNFVTSTGGLMNGSLTSGSNGSGSALTNVLNNNSITTGLLRRPQIITNTRMVGMSASTPGTSLNSSPMHHGSHGSLPQTAISPITPKTPPATYRQRIDVHYSSLPRQAFATTLSTVSTSSGSSTATDSNANPKRNVAFGKCSVSYEDYLTHTSNATKQEAQETSLASISDENKRSDQPSDRKSGPVFIGSDSNANHAGCDTRSIDYPTADKNNYYVIHPPFGMSSSMNALSLAAALSGTHICNLKNMQSTSASAQELLFDQLVSESTSTTRTNADQSEEPRQQERANTEPPSPKITDDSLKQYAEIKQKDSRENATNSLVALTSAADKKNLSKLQLFSSTPASRPRIHNKIDKLRGFSVPNLGFISSIILA